jgi:hypothetical protein
VKLLSKIRQHLDRRAIASSPPISVSANGFSVESSFVTWADIQGIRAYKRDLITTDEVCFVFALKSGLELTVTEEQPGFKELVVSLSQEFPSTVGWRSHVIKPAFAPNHTVLFRRT